MTTSIKFSVDVRMLHQIRDLTLLNNAAEVLQSVLEENLERTSNESSIYVDITREGCDDALHGIASICIDGYSFPMIDAPYFPIRAMILQRLTHVTRDLFAVVTYHHEPIEFFTARWQAERFVVQLDLEGDIIEEAIGEILEDPWGIRLPNGDVEWGVSYSTYERYKDKVIPRSYEEIVSSARNYVSIEE